MSTTDNTTMDDAAYVLNSKYRSAVIEELRDGPARPVDIATTHGDDVAHSSRALSELSDRDIVELIVSEDVKKGRFYALTSHGHTVADRAAELDR